MKNLYKFNNCHLFWAILVISTFANCNKLIAQQEANYTQYMYNTMALNPAYTGTVQGLQANLLYRNQWVDVEGAPEIQNFGLHSPLRNERIGLGFHVINDKIGPSSELEINGDFSYKLKTSYSSILALGLNAGARVLNIDWSKGRFYDQDDVLLNDNIKNRWMPSLGAGAYFYSDKWYLGFSVPNFIRSDYYSDVQEAVLSDRIHYYVIGGYVFDLSPSLKFKPAFFSRIVSGAPLSVDISANFLLEEFLSLGASYRWDDSVSFLAGFQIFDSFFLGYSFDYTTSDFRKYNNGTHEVILRYTLLNDSGKINSSPRFF